MQNHRDYIKFEGSVPSSSDFPAQHMEWIQKYQSQNILHYHDSLEIGLCTEGIGTEMIGNQVYPFSSNCISVIPAYCIHDSQIPMKIYDKGSVWKFIFVRLESLGISCKEFNGFLTDNEHLVSLFHLMYYELEQKPYDYEEVFRSLLNCFLVHVNRSMTQDNCSNSLPLPRELESIVQFIHSSYNDDISVATLARKYHLSESSLNRMFKRYFNVSPLTYIQDIRLTTAVNLVRNTNLSILEIASAVGYDTLSSFNRAFRKKYQISPRTMRHKLQTSHETNQDNSESK